MPRDGQATRERIILSATRLFAIAGFDGVSARGIAEEAGVTLRLVQHHFGDKESLYRAVWERSAVGRAGDRREAVATFDYDLPQGTALRRMVLIFARPLWEAAKTQTPTSFLRIIAREAVDPRAENRGLIADFLDVEAAMFVEAFNRLIPTASRSDVVTCYMWMATGVFFFLTAAEPRNKRLAGLDGEIQFDRFVDYALAAWIRLADDYEN